MDFTQSVFQIFPTLLQLIIGVAAITIVLTQWKPSTERTLFASIAACFVMGSVFMLLASFMAFASYDLFNGMAGNSFGLFLSLIYYSHLLLPVVAIILILVLALRLRNNDSLQPNNFLPQAGSFRGNPDNSIPLTDQRAFAESWKTDLTAVSRIKLLRKREWAFLADILPAITFNVFLLWVASISTNRLGSNPFDEMVFSLMMLVTFILGVYVLFKDSFSGMSYGKRLAGCRIVKLSDGSPIGAGESMARNFIFLIPFAAIVELAVASLRMDRRRIGDLIANTTAVSGEPDYIYGADNPNKQVEEETLNPDQPHPLDD